MPIIQAPSRQSAYLALLASLAFPTATKAADCSALEDIARHQPRQFEQLKGDLRPGASLGGIWDVVSGPNSAGFEADDCRIVRDSTTVRYECSRRYETWKSNAIKAQLENDFESASSDLATCLAVERSSQREVRFASRNWSNRTFTLSSRRGLRLSMSINTRE